MPSGAFHERSSPLPSGCMVRTPGPSVLTSAGGDANPISDGRLAAFSFRR